MQAVISEVVAVGRNLMDPFPFFVAVGLGLLLATGTAARLLTAIQDFTPMRRTS